MHSENLILSQFPLGHASSTFEICRSSATTWCQIAILTWAESNKIVSEVSSETEVFQNLIEAEIARLKVLVAELYTVQSVQSRASRKLTTAKNCVDGTTFSYASCTICVVVTVAIFWYHDMFKSLAEAIFFTLCIFFYCPFLIIPIYVIFHLLWKWLPEKLFPNYFTRIRSQLLDLESEGKVLKQRIDEIEEEIGSILSRPLNERRQFLSTCDADSIESKNAVDRYENLIRACQDFLSQSGVSSRCLGDHRQYRLNRLQEHQRRMKAEAKKLKAAFASAPNSSNIENGASPQARTRNEESTEVDWAHTPYKAGVTEAEIDLRYSGLKQNLDLFKKQNLDRRRFDTPGFGFDLSEYERMIEEARRVCLFYGQSPAWLYDHTFYAKSRRETAPFSIIHSDSRSKAATLGNERIGPPLEPTAPVDSQMEMQADGDKSQSEENVIESETTKRTDDIPAEQVVVGTDGMSKIQDVETELELPPNSELVDFAVSLNDSDDNDREVEVEQIDQQVFDFNIDTRIDDNSLRSQGTPTEGPVQPRIPGPLRNGRHRTTPPEKLFTGTSRVYNWPELNLIRKETGDQGEEVVFLIEYQFLLDAGKFDLAGKVKNVSKDLGDGAGYDVLSYFLDGRPKYIEVKTTSSDIDRPFYLSKNERDFMERERETCFVYRVSLADLPPSVRVYTVDQLFADSEITPTQFLVKMNIHNDPIISFEN